MWKTHTCWAAGTLEWALTDVEWAVPAATSWAPFLVMVHDDGMDCTELDRAEGELGSLLRKCEAVVRGSTLSPSRRTLMTNRVAALRVAIALVAEEKARRTA